MEAYFKQDMKKRKHAHLVNVKYHQIQFLLKFNSLRLVFFEIKLNRVINEFETLYCN